ncbi:MAG: hypothetical protein MZV70_02585 [Desulfobacterales bacterium]|nr:hypothetical protein [Desulfobacterales bacterium]
MSIRHRSVRAKVDDCILYGLCVRVCKDRIGASALSFRTTGENRDRVVEFSRHVA